VDKGALVLDKGDLERNKGNLVLDKGNLVLDKGNLVLDKLGASLKQAIRAPDLGGQYQGKDLGVKVEPGASQAPKYGVF